MTAAAVAMALGASVLAATASTTAAQSTTLPTAVEAWYLGPGAFPEPAGDPGLPGLPAANPYPEGTLHVGVSAGAENARTYVKLDAATLPDATVTDARLVLPIDPSDGTLAPETATIDVCFAPDAGPAVEGSLSTPPPVDCSASSRAEYRAEPKPHFVADLAPLGFGPALRTGAVAILPSSVARAQNATWHVAFFATSSAPTPDDTIHAEVELAAALVAPSAIPPPAPAVVAADPVTSVEVDERPTFEDIPAASFVATEPLGPPPLLSDRPITAAPAFAQAPELDDGFAYSIVLLLPLVLFAALAITASALTKPPSVRRVAVEQDNPT